MNIQTVSNHNDIETQEAWMWAYQEKQLKKYIFYNK